MVHVEVIRISYYSPGKGYAVLLKEVGGVRQLPIIVGSAEAQAIALAFEGIEMPRPLTHDLLVDVIDHFDADLEKVIITHLSSGTYFAKLILDSDLMGKIEIDSRPSDAIAVCLRMEAPLFVNEKILEQVAMDSIKIDSSHDDVPETRVTELSFEETMENLQSILNRAIEEENYEAAAKIRDRISSLEKEP
ncbi:MAG: bifunctional nuclease family protein [FCB group bacterium]|nr:bifunctional nuclease family protein [FCB group bacterium]